ncbi:MAG: cell division protein FtsK, partial [Microbacteriaceae bacterium]
MPTSTRSKAPARGRTTSSRTRATTKRMPVRPVPDEGPGLIARAWLGLAHVVGGAARVLGQETLARDERRDGVPFFIVLLAVVGAVVEWFLPSDPVARALDAWTFGGLVGRVASGLPVIMLVFAVWLFRHPRSVHDNRRIGIGLGVLIGAIAALCQTFGGLPAPAAGPEALAVAGGLVGWLVTWPFAALSVAWLSVPLAVVVGVFSLFIITKTPPNRVGDRLREAWAYLFGTELSAPAARTERLQRARVTADATGPIAFGTDGAGTAGVGTLGDLGPGSLSPAGLPWWRRSKSRGGEAAAFDTPVVAVEGGTVGVTEGLTEVLGTAGPSAPAGPAPSLLDDALLDDLDAAEAAVRRFSGEVAVGHTGVREDAGVLPGFAVGASAKGAAGEFAEAAPAPDARPRAAAEP